MSRHNIVNGMKTFGEKVIRAPVCAVRCRAASLSNSSVEADSSSCLLKVLDMVRSLDSGNGIEACQIAVRE